MCWRGQSTCLGRELCCSGRQPAPAHAPAVRADNDTCAPSQPSVQGGETLVSAIFGGALRSEVKAQGARASATIQAFTHLQLDVLPERVQSVADAFDFLTSPERLDGGALASEVQGLAPARCLCAFELRA